LQELELGGQLPPEIANLISRRAGARAGSVGVLGSPTGRDVVARDLGLTSFDIRNQRLAAAERLGGAEQFENIGQQALTSQIGKFNIQNRQGIAGLLSGLQSQETQRLLQLAGFGQDIEQPTIGLGGADIANLTVAELNAANQFALDTAAIQAQNVAASRASSASTTGALAQAGGTVLGSIISR